MTITTGPATLEVNTCSSVADTALAVFVQPGAIFDPGVVEVNPPDQNSQVQSPFAGDDPGAVRHTVCAPKGQPSIHTVSQWGC